MKHRLLRRFRARPRSSSRAGIYACVLLAVLSLWAAPATGQEAPPTLRHDTSHVPVRTPAPDRLEPYRADPDFQYDRTPPPAETLWERFWTWVDNTLFSPETRTLRRYLFYALIGAVVVFALLRLLRMEARSLFYGRAAPAHVAMQTIEENLDATDLDRRIKEAVAQRAYRLAVRFMYLKALQELSARALIAWHPDKTNHAYVDEVRHTELHRPFAELTYLFEYVWYGDFEVNEPTFAYVQATFSRFHAALQPEPAGA